MRLLVVLVIASASHCGEPGKKSGESVDKAWKRCANDYDCAVKCVNAYVKRYKGGCSGKSACETMARLHNGGPSGCKISGTVGYWNDVKKCVNN
ncbi:Protein ILYS-3 [Aphelenchoides avenae]|nr:Protein ILYS-3 [Aphelenchus avenae]